MNIDYNQLYKFMLQTNYIYIYTSLIFVTNYVFYFINVLQAKGVQNKQVSLCAQFLPSTQHTH